MPTFSIIVPIYNAEKTLRKCLDSVQAQTYPDFEVLMIENGSQDTSSAICRSYAAQDARFVLYSCKDNKGPSGARNIGLDHASGAYVAFVDSDDYVEPDYLAVLLEALRDSDIVFFGYHQISVNGTFLGDHIPPISDYRGYHETLLELYRQDMFGYTWIKAFRHAAIGTHRFSEELNLLEDEVFTCDILAEPQKIKIVPKALLNYVTGNAGSLIGRTHPDYCQKVDAAYKAWKRLLDSYDNKDEVLKNMANSHVNRCMYYGFERELDVEDFFGLLKKSEFFTCSTAESEFVKCVKSENYRKLARMRAFYRAKNRIAKLLKK